MIGIWNWSSRSLSSTTLNPDSFEQQQQSILNKEVSIPRVYYKDVFVTIDVDDVLRPGVSAHRDCNECQTDVFLSLSHRLKGLFSSLLLNISPKFAKTH